MIITDYPWYITLVCIALGLAYAAVLYFVGPRGFGRGVRWCLAVLRFLVVSAIAFLLMAPVSRRTVNERERPHVVLAQDVSLSVRQGVDSAFSLEALIPRLEERFRVTYLPFGTDGSTDIGAALDKYRGDEVAAMVLATDGIHNRGASPQSVAEKVQFPIYCVALGDTTSQRDARISDLRCNRIVLMGSHFPVEITLQADLLRGRTAMLTVDDGVGRRVYSKQVQYEDNQYSETVVAMLHANDAGLLRYVVRVGAVDGETVLENNVQTFYVDVVDTRRKVTIVAAAPHPDLAALRMAIEGNPNYEATVVMAEEAERKGWKPADDVQMMVLHNLPSGNHPNVSYSDGLPTLYIIGLQTDLARYNALHTGLEISARSAKTNEVTALHQSAFSLFTLSEDDVRSIEAFPPLNAPFGQVRLSDGVQTLFNARLGALDTRQPMIAASAQGAYRRSYIWGEGLWRWRLADYQEHESHEVFDRLVSQMLAFTAMQASRERLQVTAERSYSLGDPVVMRAVVYNEAYEVVNDVDVHLRLTKMEKGGHHTDIGEYLFRREASDYSLTLPLSEEGIYRYRAECGNLTTEGTFALEAENLELRQTVADHNLLSSLVSVAGGAVYSPDQVQQVYEALDEIKPTIYTHRRYTELMRLPWLLALVLVLMAAEWVLRKYNGEI